MTSRPRPYEQLRQQMVEEQLRGRGITDQKVLDAFLKVPRHLYVPEKHKAEAYEDKPLPVAPGATISQPYIIARMIEALDIDSSDQILEIGTGTGYQTAILAELVTDLYTIELDPALAQRATELLQNQGYTSIHFRAGNGYQGWPEVAPFDAIIVSAAPSDIPRELVRELKIGGRMVLPLGDQEGGQELVALEKTPEGLDCEELGRVAFVEMKK